jgi:hypothetical protein
MLVESSSGTAHHPQRSIDLLANAAHQGNGRAQLAYHMFMDEMTADE